MASPTLAEAKERMHGTLVPGIIDTLVRINPVLEYLPFYPVAGGQIEYSYMTARGGIMRGTLTGGHDHHRRPVSHHRRQEGRQPDPHPR